MRDLHCLLGLVCLGAPRRHLGGDSSKVWNDLDAGAFHVSTSLMSHFNLKFKSTGACVADR